MAITAIICATILTMFFANQKKELTDYAKLLEKLAEMRSELDQMKSTQSLVQKQANETQKLLVQTNLSNAFVPRRNRENKVG